MRALTSGGLLLLLSGVFATPAGAAAGAPPSRAAGPPAGSWYAALEPSAGNEVRFGLRVSASGGKLAAALVNGKFESPFGEATWDGETLTLTFPHYDVVLTARREGEALAGTYVRTTASGKLEIPFRAVRAEPPLPVLPKGAPSVAGEWGVEIGSGEKVTRGLGVFSQKGARVSGTLLEQTGDFGPLHGTWDGERLVLSVFDGVFVYRFSAVRGADGTLAGEFRSRTNAPVPWKARPLSGADSASFLPDGFSTVRPKDPDSPFRFAFPDENGKTVSSDEAPLAGKPLVVTLMGTWCPNCNDEAPVLCDLSRRFKAKGLGVVALAFEANDDTARSFRLIRSFKDRYKVPYAVLLAGTTKGAAASPVMSQLNGWKGFPTTLYLDRAHRIVKVHSGFDGPATGERHAKLKKEMEELSATLLR